MLLVVFIIPRFQAVFEGLLRKPMPPFTLLVLSISDFFKVTFWLPA